MNPKTVKRTMSQPADERERIRGVAEGQSSQHIDTVYSGMYLDLPLIRAVTVANLIS